jgi:hypothetical protein
MRIIFEPPQDAYVYDMEDLSAELKEKTRNILPRYAKYTLIGLLKFYCVIHASNLQDYTENNNRVSQNHLKCLTLVTFNS